jgi:4-methylaminobutanoate oxidase (formaldehyde-forming)
MEKGYRAWGSDITPEDSPLEAGLGFAVAWDKDFLGREALERQRAEGLSRTLRTLSLAEPNAMCLGNEPVFADGRVIARVTSGGIGYATGTSIALAYLASGLAEPETLLEVEVFGERVGATVASGAIYDRVGERIRA